MRAFSTFAIATPRPIAALSYTSSFLTAGLILWLSVGLLGCSSGDAAPPGEIPDSFDAPPLVFAGRPMEIAELPCVAAVVYEPQSKTFLYEMNPNERRPPASIAKMMLELVVMREIEAGRLALEDSIRTSAYASSMGGSQVYLRDGEVFSLEQLLEAIAIASANDACMAVAEHIAGTGDGFALMMNREAEALGLHDTHYVNVHGLDDGVPADQIELGNYTTAHDIALLGAELVHYPEVLHWSSKPRAEFRGGEFVLENTNKLVGHFDGLDGIKTGFTSKAGFCLCASAERDGLRFISVVLGCESDRGRRNTSASLLGRAFGSYVKQDICQKGDSLEIEIDVEGGKPATIRPVASRDLSLIVSRPDDRALEISFIPREGLRAPLEAWEPVGMLRASANGEVLAEIPALAPQHVQLDGLFAWLKSMLDR